MGKPTLFICLFFIVLFRFLCSCVEGQEDNTTEVGAHFVRMPEIHYAFPEEYMKVIVGKDTVRTELGIYQTMVILTLIQQWELYEAECESDSTWSTMSVWEALRHLSDNYEIVRKEKDIYYLRKKPTLPGFMEFLNQRREK